MLLPILLLSAASPNPEVALPVTAALAADEIELGWSGALGAGTSISTGNTERTSAHATGDAVLRREGDRFTYGAFWNYASEENAEGDSNITERRVGGRFKYDYFLSERSYALFNAQGERDDLAALQLRATAGVGYGYQWYEEEKKKLSTELGINWFHEDFEGEAPNEYAAARFAYDAQYVPTERWTFNQLGEVFQSLEEDEDTNSKLDTRGRYNFSDALFAQAQWVWDWNNTPAEGKERSDHRLLLSIGYSF